MATYVYSCEVHGEFEVEHSIKDQLDKCPKCIEEGLEPKDVKRLITKTTFILNGGSWAKDNYK